VFGEHDEDNLDIYEDYPYTIYSVEIGDQLKLVLEYDNHCCDLEGNSFSCASFYLEKTLPGNQEIKYYENGITLSKLDWHAHGVVVEGDSVKLILNNHDTFTKVKLGKGFTVLSHQKLGSSEEFVTKYDNVDLFTTNLSDFVSDELILKFFSNNKFVIV